MENLSIASFTKILRSAPFHAKSAELLTSVNLVLTPETKMTEVLNIIDGTTISDELFNWYYLTIKQLIDQLKVKKCKIHTEHLKPSYLYVQLDDVMDEEVVDMLKTEIEKLHHGICIEDMTLDDFKNYKTGMESTCNDQEEDEMPALLDSDSELDPQTDAYPLRNADYEDWNEEYIEDDEEQEENWKLQAGLPMYCKLDEHYYDREENENKNENKEEKEEIMEQNKDINDQDKENIGTEVKINSSLIIL